jgi:hypothetical protein
MHRASFVVAPLSVPAQDPFAAPAAEPNSAARGRRIPSLTLTQVPIGEALKYFCALIS